MEKKLFVKVIITQTMEKTFAHFLLQKLFGLDLDFIVFLFELLNFLLRFMKILQIIKLI